jgi:VWFA-related protein
MRRLLLTFAIALSASAQVQEKITVERIIVDARVTDSRGEAITNLRPADFRVRIDGKAADVESIEWIPETAVGRDLADIDRPPAEVNRTSDVPAPRGRLLVFLFQTDFARNGVRLSGQMKLMTLSHDYTDWLEPDDRVAVLSYDSHLKFRLDFSDDKERIHDAMEHSILVDDPPRPPAVPLPSLAARLDPDAMRNAKTFEEALIILANALRPIPGTKSLILFGWGMGRFSRSGVSMEWNYGIARHALESARVSVFSIDITQADSHSLEVGLGKVAEDTGGFYAKSFHFPKQAIERLQKTLAGHYELEVRKPETKVHGVHTIEVGTTRKGAVVLARTSYVDANE